MNDFVLLRLVEGHIVLRRERCDLLLLDGLLSVETAELSLCLLGGSSRATLDGRHQVRTEGSTESRECCACAFLKRLCRDLCESPPRRVAAQRSTQHAEARATDDSDAAWDTFTSI